MNKYSNLRFWSKLSSSTELNGENEIQRINTLNNPSLLEDLNNASKRAGVIPVITTITEGEHGSNSRHYKGLAVDIASFSGIGGRGAGPSFKVAGNKLSIALQQLGYTLNVENGNPKAVLWQMDNHYGHLHVSNNVGGVSTFDPTRPTSNPSGSSSTTLSDTPTGLQYFHFDQEFIERGIRLYREYYNKRDIEDNKQGKGSGDLGFIPLTLDIKFEGISGWVIYDKIILNQNILPPQYPKNFNFVIMGVNHSINNHSWETNIQVLSVPDVVEKDWIQTNELTDPPLQAAVPGGGDVVTTASQEKYMFMVYNAFLTAGLNSNQAKIFTSEVGRENSFNPNLLFGGHPDPKRGNNLGMISWQGKRKENLIRDLKKQNLILDNGTLVRSQQCLNAQARFVLWEINNDKAYLKTKNVFLGNPDISYADGNRVIGTNYIVWAYNESNFSTGHVNRNGFYKRINEILK